MRPGSNRRPMFTDQVGIKPQRPSGAFRADHRWNKAWRWSTRLDKLITKGERFSLSNTDMQNLIKSIKNGALGSNGKPKVPPAVVFQPHQQAQR